MPCDTRLKPGQKISERKEEVTKVVATLAQRLVSGQVKVKISPDGAIAFLGLSDSDRDGVTDNCAYRRLLATSPSAAMAIARAEQLAGRRVNKQVVAQGLHSHDNGKTWHTH
jgi:hypothetical protein